jgi:hypothetical protein
VDGERRWEGHRDKKNVKQKVLASLFYQVINKISLTNGKTIYECKLQEKQQTYCG